jgi:hypothetical protein
MENLTRDSLMGFLFLNAAICIVCVAVTVISEYKRLVNFNKLVTDIQKRNSPSLSPLQPPSDL